MTFLAACTSEPEVKCCNESHFILLGYCRVFQRQTPHQPCRLRQTRLLRIMGDFFPLLSSCHLCHWFNVDYERQFWKEKHRNSSSVGFLVSEITRMQEERQWGWVDRKLGWFPPFLSCFTPFGCNGEECLIPRHPGLWTHGNRCWSSSPFVKVNPMVWTSQSSSGSLFWWGPFISTFT